MIRPRELLLGFDAREMWLEPQDWWPVSRKNLYLLRPEVVRPLSVDTMVWRDLFDAYPSLQRPEWTGPIQGMWDNLTTLQEYLERVSRQRPCPVWIIAVTLREDPVQSVDQQEWSARASNIIPSLRDAAWALLGYDVCDQWLLSGLSNCGYGTNESELEHLRRTYASDLNEYHLFDSIKPAVDFMHFADRLNPAHAPFFVFGIWLIKKDAVRLSTFLSSSTGTQECPCT